MVERKSLVLPARIATCNPANGETIERFDYASTAAVETTLAQAHESARIWRATSFDERAELLRRVAQRLRTQRESLARCAVSEMGKPLVQARAEIDKCALCCEYFADSGAAMLADEPVLTDGARSSVAFRPLGTILAIMPWNFPYWQVFRAAAPAIMAGNTFLLKHAENTTRCGLEIARIFAEAGAPRGLFTTLLVSIETADALIADSRIAGLTLTGSERAGMAVATAAGSALKKCVLELGGSDAFIVLADADVSAAARVAVQARFQNNGQSCIAAKRFIVEAPIYDEFLEAFVAGASALVIGDPMEETTTLGPCARADLRDTLEEQVRTTLEGGARLLLGGNRIERPGFFYEPTIVADVLPSQRMFEEEVFGPAAAVIRANNAEAAIALANASRYGLGCAIWSRDAERARSYSTRIEAGSVFINGMVQSDPRLPFGGIKRSGYGRELSNFGIREFTNIQTVRMD